MGAEAGGMRFVATIPPEERLLATVLGEGGPDMTEAAALDKDGIIGAVRAS